MASRKTGWLARAPRPLNLWLSLWRLRRYRRRSLRSRLLRLLRLLRRLLGLLRFLLNAD